jgi:ATP-dependent Clp protease ATP-binding subunit ClpB
MRDGHQQFSPLHMLKVLLDDSESLAGGRSLAGVIRARSKTTEDALNGCRKSRERRRTGLSRLIWRARSTPRKGRREGRRQFCHRRAAAARADAGKDSDAGAILRKAASRRKTNAA